MWTVPVVTLDILAEVGFEVKPSDDAYPVNPTGVGDSSRLPDHGRTRKERG
jgi:hypothetical protein